MLLTAIIIAGRSGSAFTAQIGTMQVNEEIDALRTLGLNPIEVLVVPRVLGLVLTLPLLVVYADFMGLLGGCLMSWASLGILIPTFLDQLRSVREGLGLGEIHLFGSSWGGMLALEYALTRPEGLVSLVLNSTPTSAPRWAEETARLAAALPEGLDEKQAEDEFKRRHICRLDPEPEVLKRSRAKFGMPVYETMWGPNEFTVTGTLKGWDVIDRLGEIRVPTLITSGRHDECTPALVEPLHQGIVGSEWVIFENSAHMAYLEEPAGYLQVVGEFLERVER